MCEASFCHSSVWFFVAYAILSSDLWIFWVGVPACVHTRSNYSCSSLYRIDSGIFRDRSRLWTNMQALSILFNPSPPFVEQKGSYFLRYTQWDISSIQGLVRSEQKCGLVSVAFEAVSSNSVYSISYQVHYRPTRVYLTAWVHHQCQAA